MLCARVEPVVNELEKEYGSRMTFVIRPRTDEGIPELLEEYDLGLHGMVITDKTGALKWKEPGHEQTREQVEAAIKKVLGE